MMVRSIDGSDIYDKVVALVPGLDLFPQHVVEALACYLIESGRPDAALRDIARSVGHQIALAGIAWGGMNSNGHPGCDEAAIDHKGGR